MRVKMFITLERCSGSSKVNGRISIIIERPSEAGEDNVVLIKSNSPMEEVPRVFSQMGILLRPPNGALDAIVVVHSIHGYKRVV